MPSAFEAAIAPLVPRLRRLARRLVADPHLAEDAVQEALLRAYRFWGQRRGPAVWPWLRQVLVRECWRVQRRHSAASAWPTVHGDGDAHASADGPEERAILAEEYQEVRRALERMPAGYQRPLRLRHGRDLAESAIAAVLGLPLGTVQWRLKRAHDHLRLVLSGRRSPPLAATLREVVRDMEFRVQTGPVGEETSPAADGDSTGAIRYEPVGLDQAMALFPGFRLPPAVLAANPDLECEVGRRGPDASRRAGELTHVSVHTAADRDRLLVEYNPPDASARPPALQVMRFPGAEIGIDEDTHVGGRLAHWTQVDRHHHLWWVSRTGAGWHVRSALPPQEVRRMAEALEAEADPGPGD